MADAEEDTLLSTRDKRGKRGHKQKKSLHLLYKCNLTTCNFKQQKNTKTIAKGACIVS